MVVGSLSQVRNLRTRRSSAGLGTCEQRQEHTAAGIPCFQNLFGSLVARTVANEQYVYVCVRHN